MSVQSQIDRIEQNVENTYDVLEEAGAVMPQTRNSNNLPSTAASISAVLYSKEQSLTEKQKAQAQRNLGVVGVITPQDYGAKGDGSTDDTKAFQDALANNRLVFVPSGTYKLSGELVIGRNCRLEMAQDVLLNFTQTSGNCISMRASSNIVGNHSAIKVPYAFTGKVINIDAALDENIVAVPPFTNWGPMWMAARYITDLHIAKFDEYGVAQSADGDCCGTAVYLRADYTHYMDFLWAVDIERLRVAGAFTYGIHLDCVINPDEPMDGFIHQTKIDAFVAGCEVAVYLKDSTLSYISARIVPQLARSGKAYAKHGIVLENSTDVDLSNSRVMDWDPNHCLWTEGGRYQHLALIGNCAGLILSEHYYYKYPSYDIRSLIYTDTPSNLEKMTILQEPITRWFKPKDGVPYFNDGDFERKLLLQDEFDECFLVDRVPNFTDALTSAIDKDGKPFNNGKGYIPYGKAWGLGSGTIADNSYYGCTGLIAIKPGDTIYTSALKWIGDGGEGAVVFDSSFNRVQSCTGITVHNMSWYFTYAETDEGFALTVKNQTNAAYIAFTFRREQIGDRPLISVNNPPTFSVNGFLADGIHVKSEYVNGLEDALDDALAEAKASGAFKGDKGDTGASGTSVTVKSVSESTADGGSNVVTFSDGKTVTVKNGSKGSAGANGKTPVRGTDYWTDADKTEIINSVLTSLPVYSGEVV